MGKKNRRGKRWHAFKWDLSHGAHLYSTSTLLRILEQRHFMVRGNGWIAYFKCGTPGPLPLNAQCSASLGTSLSNPDRAHQSPPFSSCIYSTVPVTIAITITTTSIITVILNSTSCAAHISKLKIWQLVWGHQIGSSSALNNRHHDYLWHTTSCEWSINGPPSILCKHASYPSHHPYLTQDDTMCAEAGPSMCPATSPSLRWDSSEVCKASLLCCTSLSTSVMRQKWHFSTEQSVTCLSVKHL